MLKGWVFLVVYLQRTGVLIEIIYVKIGIMFHNILRCECVVFKNLFPGNDHISGFNPVPGSNNSQENIWAN